MFDVKVYSDNSNYPTHPYALGQPFPLYTANLSWRFIHCTVSIDIRAMLVHFGLHGIVLQTHLSHAPAQMRDGYCKVLRHDAAQ
jgi:hypothetical protein